MAERDGLFQKYQVKRIHDIDDKHKDCWYFVLDPKHDPLARKALLAYAKEAESVGYVELATQLEEKANGN